MFQNQPQTVTGFPPTQTTDPHYTLIAKSHAQWFQVRELQIFLYFLMPTIFFVQPLRFLRFVAFVSQLRYRTKLCCGGGDCDSEHDSSSFRPTPAQQTDGNSCSYSTVNDITPSYCGSRSRQQTLLQASPSHFPHH